VAASAAAVGKKTRFGGFFIGIFSAFLDQKRELSPHFARNSLYLPHTLSKIW